MKNRHATLMDMDRAARIGQELDVAIDNLLTRGELEPAERDRLTRAANLIDWARSRINGIGHLDKPVTPSHAALL